MTAHNQLRLLLDVNVLGKRMAQGAGIAFVLLVLFFTVVFFTSKNSIGLGNKIFVPIMSVTVGGACGGLFYYLMGYVRMYGGWKKVFANITSLLVYIIGLWLSLVYGLSLIGLWN